jgi:hypothetical protein
LSHGLAFLSLEPFLLLLALGFGLGFTLLAFSAHPGGLQGRALLGGGTGLLNVVRHSGAARRV